MLREAACCLYFPIAWDS
uniref:Uncharacterized protein n=1 Tax=Rhizophora mucronata TaxID=61149 RepID=A0A2P2P3E9_RHIMU